MGFFDFFKRKKPVGQEDERGEANQEEGLQASKIKIPLEEAIKITLHGDDEEMLMFFSTLKHKAIFNGETPPGYVEMDVERYERDLRISNERLERDELLNETARLNNVGIALEKEGRIDEAIETYENNISLGYKAAHSFDRLRILYRKRKDYENMIRVIKREGEVFDYTQVEIEDKINRYLEKKDRPKIDIVLPRVRQQAVIEGETLESKFKAITDRLPEFDFYTTADQGQRNIIPMDESRNMADIRDEIKHKIDLGAEHERHGRLDLAVPLYEDLIANHVHNTKPYDRLIMIYKRAKLFDDARDVLEFSINFFRSLKQNQYKYIHYLADKYGVSEIHGVPIDEYGKIYYYAGVFELYNPYPIIEKWEKQLESLKN